MHTKVQMKTSTMVQKRAREHVMRILRVHVNSFSKKEFSMFINVKKCDYLLTNFFSYNKLNFLDSWK